MEESFSSSQKSSGLLARIQALQAQDLTKSDETVTSETLSPSDSSETVVGSFDSTPDEAFNFPDNDNPFADSIYPEPDIPLNSEDAFTLGDYTLNRTEETTESTDFETEESPFDTADTAWDEQTGTDPDFSIGTDLNLDSDFSFEPQPEQEQNIFEDEPEESVFNDSDFEQMGTDPDLDFSTPSPSFSSSGSGSLSFTGLYDKETIMGDSSDQSNEIQKKTRVPVIICVVCAAICLIATTLILFIIPSRYNLITKKTVKVDDNTIIIETESHNPEEKIKDNNSELQKLIDQSEVPPAKENEVVVVEKAEEVIPTPPVVDRSTNKAEQYKIKWGDTLWDISNTYYKNPWKYKKIATYNKISNPDYIISGTTITIPAE